MLWGGMRVGRDWDGVEAVAIGRDGVRQLGAQPEVTILGGSAGGYHIRGLSRRLPY